MLNATGKMPALNLAAGGSVSYPTMRQRPAADRGTPGSIKNYGVLILRTETQDFEVLAPEAVAVALEQYMRSAR